MEETKHRRWSTNKVVQFVEQHNALYNAWEASTAEVDRLRTELAERREADWVLAADAERLAMDAQTTPVDLPDEETLAERLHEAYESVWPEDGRLKWNKLQIDGLQRKGRMAQSRAVLDLLCPWLAERAPVADAETLEDLVKIVYDAVWQCAMAKPKWEYIEEERKIQWRSAVAAVLRAARPYVDMSRYEIAVALDTSKSREDLLEKIDKNIRYRVEVRIRQQPRAHDAVRALRGRGSNTRDCGGAH